MYVCISQVLQITPLETHRLAPFGPGHQGLSTCQRFGNVWENPIDRGLFGIPSIIYVLLKG